VKLPLNMEPNIHNRFYTLKEGIKFLHSHKLHQIVNAAKFIYYSEKPMVKLPWYPVIITVLIESRCNQACRFCH
jgi:hypothetical protein